MRDHREQLNCHQFSVCSVNRLKGVAALALQPKSSLLQTFNARLKRMQPVSDLLQLHLYILFALMTLHGSSKGYRRRNRELYARFRSKIGDGDFCHNHNNLAHLKSFRNGVLKCLTHFSPRRRMQKNSIFVHFIIRFLMLTQKIAVIGECMIELSQNGAQVQRGFGGDTLNTSVYLARQVSESALEVHYVTALGEDSFSQQMLDSWRQERLHTALIQRLEHRLPGLYYIETDSHGERTFYYWRNEAAARFWLESERSEEICAELAQFDYLYLSGISLAILNETSREKLLAMLKQARANGCKVIFDNNYRPRLWASPEETQRVYQQMLACTDIAFLTLDDEDLLWGTVPAGEVIRRTHAAGVRRSGDQAGRRVLPGVGHR
ncbi:5-dehydro-2-deoxygluconokinase [Cedecea neteri]|uniref:2-dehydro-3-deoxygluconokinase n=1 Tax=Cedecea neteri TaxID=158822 RepID=A0A2X2T9R2_9ENTR|nr:5-dehydro-2-deoxygluconokinase [Cedecea neteri]